MTEKPNAAMSSMHSSLVSRQTEVAEMQVAPQPCRLAKVHVGVCAALGAITCAVFLAARALAPAEPADPPPPPPPQFSALAIGLLVVTLYNFIKLPFMIQAGWTLPNVMRCPFAGLNSGKREYTFSPPVFRPAGVDIKIHAAPKFLVFHLISATAVEAIYISKELGYLTAAAAAAPLCPTLLVCCASMVPMRNNIGPMPVDKATAANWYAIIAIAIGSLANVHLHNVALHYTIMAAFNLPSMVDVLAVVGVVAKTCHSMVTSKEEEAG